MTTTIESAYWKSNKKLAIKYTVDYSGIAFFKIDNKAVGNQTVIPGTYTPTLETPGVNSYIDHTLCIDESCIHVTILPPSTGEYYGEKIPVIIATDIDDFADPILFNDGLNMIRDKFSTIYPYKNLSIDYIKETGRVTDNPSFQQELEKIAAAVEIDNPAPDDTKYLLIIWCPYWLYGAQLATIQKIGKYIYAYAMMRSSEGKHFPYPLLQVGHELCHLLGLTGDGDHVLSVLSGSTDSIKLAEETASDYIWGGDEIIWLAEDEKLAVSNKLFNDGQRSLVYLFGCRCDIKIPWYHNYVYTTTLHDTYSATWDEVMKLINRINDGSTINKDVCKLSLELSVT